MRRDRREIEQVFRRAGWQSFAFNLKRSWFFWVIAALLLVVTTYYNSSPRRVVEVVHGTAIAAHLPATEDNSAPLIIAVRLDNHAIVNVPVPHGTLYRAGSRVDVAVIRREWPPHSITYRFLGYTE